MVITSCSAIEEEKNPTLGGGVVVLNPNNLTPLSAIYYLSSINNTPITVRVHGKTPDMDIAYTYPANYSKEIPIHGLYPNYRNTITIIENGEKKQISVRTASLENSVETTITKEDSSIKDPFNQDLYFLSGFDKGTLAFDSKGDIRYYIQNKFLYANKLIYQNGEILLYDSGSIRDLLGNIKLEFNIGHDIVPYKNNTYLATLSASLDTVAEIDSSGKSVNLQSIGKLFRDAIDPNEMGLLNQVVYDTQNIYVNPLTGKKEYPTFGWGALNSLVYDKDTDILYLSLRHQGVIAVDYSRWKLIWWMTDDNLDTQRPSVPITLNFNDIPSLQSYRVKGDAETDGPKNQHALLLRANGNLAMFDNQGDGSSSTTGSRYVEYKITETQGNYSSTIVSEFQDPTSYSRLRSDIDLLRDNQILLMYSCASKLQVVDMGTPNNVIFEMTFPSLISFRSDKMPLYPYSDNRKYPIEFNEKIGL